MPQPGLPRLVIRSLMAEYEAKSCNQCHQLLTEIENHGQRLRGCLTCNLWASVEGGRWIRLSRRTFARFIFCVTANGRSSATKTLALN